MSKKDQTDQEPADAGPQYETESTLDSEPAPVDDDDPDFDDIEVDLSDDYMVADIRDVMLGHFRSAQKPWPQMTEEEQRGLANSFEAAGRALVRQAIQKINDVGFDRVVITLGEIKLKPGKDIEGKFTCPNIAVNRDVLGEYGGEMCTLVMVDSDRFDAQRAAAVDRDDPELPIGDGPDAGEPEPAEQEAADAE